jgi:ABC-type uncharacterized transport system permease subunit
MSSQTILKLIGLFITIWYFPVFVVKVKRDKSISGAFLFIQAVGITLFIVMQFNLWR